MDHMHTGHVGAPTARAHIQHFASLLQVIHCLRGSRQCQTVHRPSRLPAQDETRIRINPHPSRPYRSTLSLHAPSHQLKIGGPGLPSLRPSDAMSNTVTALRLVQISIRVRVHRWVVLTRQGSGSEPERRCELCIGSGRCVIWFQKSVLKEAVRTGGLCTWY
jgi:hypothetical protein